MKSSPFLAGQIAERGMPGGQGVFVLLILVEGVLRLVPRAEVMHLPPDFLRPLPGGVA
jgi:hypothetical protein